MAENQLAGLAMVNVSDQYNSCFSSGGMVAWLELVQERLRT